MSNEKTFWQFYAIIQDTIAKQEEGKPFKVDAVLKEQLAPIEQESGDFFYYLVVLGDELLLNADFDPVLEREYKRSAEGRKKTFRDIEEFLQKKSWNKREQEIAWLYYYMLIAGFRKKSDANFQKRHTDMLDTFQEKLFEKPPEELLRSRKGLTPKVYDSVYEGPEKLNLIPSWKHTLVWALFVLVSLIFFLNGIWNSISENIITNLDNIDKRVTQKERG